MASRPPRSSRFERSVVRRNRCAAVVVLLLLPVFCGAARKDEAATRPSGQALLKGQIPYSPPLDWTENKKSRSETLAVYVSPKRDGATSIEVLPIDAEVKSALILMKLRMMHKAGKHVMVMEPTVEEDPRFTLRIHDKYKAGEKVADVLHLYRNLGPRIVMVTVSSLADDADATKAIHATGEELVLSVTYQKPTVGAKKR